MSMFYNINKLINYKENEKLIYLDNNATTQIAPEVLSEMLPYLTLYYGNPSSLYRFSTNISKKIKESREKVADLLNCSYEEILFTSCGTESNNSAILSALQINPSKKHIITSKVEHPSIRNLLLHLQKRDYRITFLNVNNKGQLDIQELKDSITNDTALISIMYANNETGVIFNISEIGKIAKNAGIPFHVDAVQAVGKIPIDLQKSPIDFLSLSGHKIHAPKGIGALFIREGVKFLPFLKGGHQENGKRAGTENVASIIALGKAAEIAKENLLTKNHQIRLLRNKLEYNLLNIIPNIQINGDLENRLPNTSNISFKYVEGESILFMLDKENICISTGSACSSRSLDPSHVLKAMKIAPMYLNGSIRISLSQYTTEKEIELASKIFPKIILKLRGLSPFGI